jgi:hypothetical protein
VSTPTSQSAVCFSRRTCERTRLTLPPDAQRASTGTAPPAVHQPTGHQPVVHQPAVAGPSGPPPSSATTPVTVPASALASLNAITSAMGHSLHPHPTAQHYTQGYVQPSAPAASSPPTLVYPPVMNAASTQYPPPPSVPGYNHAFIQPSVSRPNNNPDFPIDPILLPNDAEIDAMINSGVYQRTRILRRDQGEDQGEDQEGEQGEEQGEGQR